MIYSLYHKSLQPNTAMQPTPSVGPILLLGSMSSAAASAMLVPASWARLMASRSAAASRMFVSVLLLFVKSV